MSSWSITRHSTADCKWASTRCSSAFNRRHSAPADAATQFYALFGLSRLSGTILVSIGVISTRFSQISCQLSLSPYITRHSHQLISTVVPRLSVLSISKHAREVNGHTRRSTCLELAVSRGIWRCTIQIGCQLMGGWRLTPPPPEPSSSPRLLFQFPFSSDFVLITLAERLNISCRTWLADLLHHCAQAEFSLIISRLKKSKFAIWRSCSCVKTKIQRHVTVGSQLVCCSQLVISFKMRWWQINTWFSQKLNIRFCENNLFVCHTRDMHETVVTQPTQHVDTANSCRMHLSKTLAGSAFMCKKVIICTYTLCSRALQKRSLVRLDEEIKRQLDGQSVCTSDILI